MTSKPIVVSILNQKLALRGDGDEDYVHEVAGFVDGKVREVMRETKTQSNVSVALLACLNIADEYFRYRKKKASGASRAAGQVRDLIGLMDSEVFGASPRAL